MRLTVRGNIVKLYGAIHQPVVTDDAPGRGTITGWSPRSRRRLLDTLNSLVFARAVMVTLTYHDNVTDIDVTRRHWHAYRTHSVRLGLAGIWVREIQRRGAYHYHILYLDAALPDVQSAAAHWYRVESADDVHHKMYGVHVRDVDAPARAVAYIAKYVTKSGHDVYPGRRWGVFGNPRRAATVESEIHGDAAERLWVWMASNRATVYQADGVRAAIMYLGCLGQDTDAALRTVYGALASTAPCWERNALTGA